MAADRVVDRFGAAWGSISLRGRCAGRVVTYDGSFSIANYTVDNPVGIFHCSVAVAILTANIVYFISHLLAFLRSIGLRGNFCPVGPIYFRLATSADRPRRS